MHKIVFRFIWSRLK